MPARGSRASLLNLRINGEHREVVDNLTLQELISQLDLTPERIAIELNQNVVRRAEWPSTVLKENDRVEIVHFVGGGGREQPGCRSRKLEAGSRKRMNSVGKRSQSEKAAINGHTNRHEIIVSAISGDFVDRA
jgi:sulfur carrier protein